MKPSQRVNNYLYYFSLRNKINTAAKLDVNGNNKCYCLLRILLWDELYLVYGEWVYVVSNSTRYQIAPFSLYLSAFLTVRPVLF